MLLGRPLNSSLGVAAGPLLNSKWVEAYARLGFDVLTYATVRSTFQPAYALPNIRHVDNREQAAVVSRPTSNGDGATIAVSLGEPSMEPDVWRKDLRRARERIGRGQILIASVIGTPHLGGDADALIADYAQVAGWAAEAGAWDRAILAVGGISTVERARDVLREGADAALVATAALFDPLFATRFRQIRTAEVA